jgi:hypothetical protein
MFIGPPGSCVVVGSDHRLTPSALASAFTRSVDGFLLTDRLRRTGARQPERGQELFLPLGVSLDAGGAAAEVRSLERWVLDIGARGKLDLSPGRA